MHFHRGPTVSLAAAQFLSRTSGLTSKRANLYTRLIDGLRQDGVWSVIDCLYVLATDSEANAKLNLKSSSFTITETGAVTFIPDVGYSCGDADTINYLNSNFNPFTANGHWVQNSAHSSVWCNTNATSASGTLAASDGTSNSFMTVRNGSDQFIGRVNCNPSNSVTVTSITNSIGHWLVSRTGANTLEAYKDAVLIGTDANSSVAVTNQPFGVGARNSLGGFAGGGQQISACTFGGGLSAAQVAALRNRLAIYRAAVGL